MIEYTQEDVDRMQENAKRLAQQELVSEVKKGSSARSRKAFDEWNKARKTKQI